MKHILFFLLGILTYTSVSAQQNIYKWRVGVHGGIGLYYGDLSTGRVLDPQSEMLRFWTDNAKNLSYGLSIERAMTNAWSFRLKGTKGVFMGNDRTQKWNGDAYTKNDNYGRALNFRTEYWDGDAIFIYNFDNGVLLGEKAFFAPYIGAGVGYMSFKVKGDLYNKDGKRYHYWADNTIRSLAENDPNAATATIVEQDGVYETDLSSLKTEGKKYDKGTLTFPFALGFKFRLTDRFNINLETLLHYTLTDYLDDVANYYPLTYDSQEQAYAANPSGVLRNKRGNSSRAYDIYGTLNLSAHYNFGYKKQSFRAPVFYLGNADIQREKIQPTVPTPKPKIQPVLPKKIEVVEEKPVKPTTVVIENINIVQPENGATEDKVVRDTVYESGKVIREKVIIRRDTIIQVIKHDVYRDTIGYKREVKLLDEIEPEMVEVELYDPKAAIDTVVTFDPETMEEEYTIYQGIVPIEPVPTTLVFEPLVLDTVNIEKVDAVYIEENIGYKKDDLTQEEEVLSEVQESNFELIALRNKINELKNQKERNRADIDAVYRKMDKIENDIREIESYNNHVSVSSSGVEQQKVNDEIQKAADKLDRDMSQVRSEAIYLESDKTVSVEEYNRVRKESEERIAALEKEMRKMRKPIRRDKKKKVRRGYAVNQSRIDDKNKEVTSSELISPPAQQIIVENTNPAKELEYQAKILDLERQLAQANNKQPVANGQSTEIRLLEEKIRELRAANELKKAQAENQATLNYIKSLERKLEEVNRNLSKTQSELTTIKNRPTPKPTTTYVQPSKTIIRPATPVVSPAREAINRLGNVNVYFNKGQSSVKTEYTNDLNRVLSLMQQYPQIIANVTGYADKSGNPDINFRISKKRSEAVANYLRQRGIANHRIQVNYLGEAQATSKNDPYARRVEIILRD